MKLLEEIKTLEDVCDYIGYSVSRRKFFNEKKNLKEYAEEVNDPNLLRIVNNLSYEKYISVNPSVVFYDIMDLDNRIIHEYQKTQISNQPRNQILLRLRAVSILYWYGFEKEEIVNLKTEEIDFENKTIRNIQFGDYEFNVIKDYTESHYADYYDPQYKLSYLASKYFIKTVRYNVERSVAISRDFKQFKIHTNDALQLKGNFIKINGMFDEIYRVEMQHNELTENQCIRKVLEDKKESKDYFKQIQPLYQKWKQMYLSR